MISGSVSLSSLAPASPHHNGVCCEESLSTSWGLDGARGFCGGAYERMQIAQRAIASELPLWMLGWHLFACPTDVAIFSP
uniref:Uncharacterized protein n=1 Tax=Magnetococcus massalia (strain MO-1) TaxID=451514 RepID=A0A1S7LCU2_MAGMO|nr:protein of unknown function [Candidatus Magnetococcus massalia]